MILLNGNPVNVTMFPDNTSQVWKLDTSSFSEPSTIKWEFHDEGEFMQLAQLKMLLDKYNISSSLELSYLPYGRQDKEVTNNTTFALNTFAKLLNTLKFKEVRCSDPHSSVAGMLINNFTATYPMKEVEEVVRGNEIDLVCYPDTGAVNKYIELYDYEHIYGVKNRDQMTGTILNYHLVGNPMGKNVLILDDLCDAGGTFKLLARDLLAAGATKVVLFVTHGLFTKGVNTILDSGISKIYTPKGEVSNRSQTVQL